DELRIYTQVNVTSLGGATGQRGAGLTVFTSGDLVTGWRCLGSLPTDTLLITDLANNQVEASIAGWPVAEEQIVPVVLTSYPNNLTSAQNLDCHYNLDVSALDLTPPATGSSFGLTVSGATAEFEYLFAILSHDNGITPMCDGGVCTGG
ncbi:MAG TPA: hypothetical protein VL172_20680, partial [Kofleriaceae bacterium]|nr:hypothetical protein [Kofleriaceae bacterium]